jgi:predicted nucleotidyltransferase
MVAMSTKSEKISKIPQLWYKALLKRDSNWEKHRIESLHHLNSALVTLKKKYQWETIYIFGSIILKGRFKPHSDIDIAIKGLNSLEYYQFVGDISAALGKRVDVVLLEECQFASSIQKKGMRWIQDNT